MTVVRGFVAIVVAGLVLAACSQLTEPEAEILAQDDENEECYPLFAGQDTEVGQVCVQEDGEDLTVVYETSEDWMLTETHLVVSNEVPGTDEWLDAGWQNGKENPVPGQFPHSNTHDPPVHTFTYTVEDLDPDLYIAAHAVVEEVLVEGGYFADAVLNDEQGLQVNLEPIPAARSNPERALTQDYPLDAPSDDDIGFFSLGFGYDNDAFLGEGGSIEVGFECPVANGDGDDLRIWEVTFGTYPDETADVYAWDDTDEVWVSLGEADNADQGPQGSHEALTVSSFDLGDLDSTNAIRIVDTSDPNDFASSSRSNADGFDLDGVEALQDCTRDETAWGANEQGEHRFVDPGNWATYIIHPEPTE